MALVFGFYYKSLFKNLSHYKNIILIFSSVTILQQGHGFRNDLAQMIADIKPRFIRFPGQYYVWALTAAVGLFCI